MIGTRVTNQPPMKKGSPDDYQTPAIALEPILPYLKKEWVIWECASGSEILVKRLESIGYSVISSDIIKGQNFLNWIPERSWNFILTNPPYSLKLEFLERCYYLGGPFALLMPLTALETYKRQRLFKKYGIQLILFDKRINFITPSENGSGSCFATAWFTHGLDLPSSLNFTVLKDPEQTSLRNCGGNTND